MKCRLCLLLAVLSLALIACPNPTNNGHESIVWAEPLVDTVYVRPTAAGLGDGSSWENAFGDLQDAIEDAVMKSKTQVLVLQGTYTPKSQVNSDTGTGDRAFHFALRDGITVIGGFRGDEIANTPDLVQSATILSGVLEGGDNVYHVFFHATSTAVDNTAVLKNVTISGGKADGAGVNRQGGGMHNDTSNPTLANVSFTNNTGSQGGGMYNNNSSPNLTDVSFSDNQADFGGGTFNSFSSSPSLTNVSFTGNTVTNNGGGIYNSSTSAPTGMPIDGGGNTPDFVFP